MSHNNLLLAPHNTQKVYIMQQFKATQIIPSPSSSSSRNTPQHTRIHNQKKKTHNAHYTHNGSIHYLHHHTQYSTTLYTTFPATHSNTSASQCQCQCQSATCGSEAGSEGDVWPRVSPGRSTVPMCASQGAVTTLSNRVSVTSLSPPSTPRLPHSPPSPTPLFHT